MEESPVESARRLGQQIFASQTAQQYRSARERAFADPDTAAMLSRQARLRMKLEGEAIAHGKEDEATRQEWEQLSALLQFNPVAADYLMAEYNYTRLMDRVIEAISSEAGMILPGETHAEEQ